MSGGYVRPWTGFVWLHQIYPVKIPDLSSRGVRNVWSTRNFPKFKSFFSTLILELRGTKLMKLGHEGLLNTRNTFPKEDFPKSKYFPINLGLTQKPRVSR
jgi:hypothetical protein